MKKVVMTKVLAMMGAMVLGAGAMVAQAPPVVSPATQDAERAAQAPAPKANANPFPKIDPKNFNAESPTRDEVDSFLKAMWGYDENRIWQVAAILKTPAPGVSKVVVFVADKSQPGKGGPTVFFTTPDGKHAIADSVIPFGVKPFADVRKVLQERATGASEGAKSNDLMLVEFADLQCPHCKEAQDTMNHLQQDFPQAKIVFENFPIAEIHPFAFRAAAEGVCIRKQKGDAAFFQYVQSVFDKQGALTPESADAALEAAATAAGADPKAAASCAATDAAKDAVNAEEQLGKDIGIDQTPILVVNGHPLPIGSVSYETLKKIVAFQAGQDGITVKLQPSLNTLK